MTRLYTPIVFGPGITIRETPSDPKHGVRLQDLQTFAMMQVAEFSNKTSVSIPKRSNAQKFIVQVYDENSNLIIPDDINQAGADIVISFLIPQSGEVLVFSIGSI